MLRINPLSRAYRLTLWRMIYHQCLHGSCYLLAIVFHRAFGWPMIGLMQDKKIPHVVLRLPDGRYRDVRGIITEAAIGTPYGFKPPYTLVEVGEDRLRELQPGITEDVLDSLRDKAEVIWPHFPWPESAKRQRVTAFLTALEALSREHGLWVRGTVPAQLVVLAAASGTEVGYTAQPDAIGGDYLFNRSYGEVTRPTEDTTELTLAELDAPDED